MEKGINTNQTIQGVLIAILIFTSSCNESTPQTAADSVRAKLMAVTWKVQTVMADGVDQSSFISGMTINFGSSNYTSTNGGAIWPVNESWKFADAKGTAFERSDGIIVTIQSISDTSLVMSLTWTKTTLGQGRVQSIPGRYVFTFGI